MNQGDHETTMSEWEVIRSPRGMDYMEMRISSTVEGCPYVFDQTVRITQSDMVECSRDRLGSFQQTAIRDASMLQQDRVFHIKKLTMSQPVHNWILDDWIRAAPFLFTNVNGTPLEEELKNEEEMQKERDTRL